MSALDNFLNNINVDEELKKNQKEVILKQEAQPELSNIQVATDVAASAATGAAQGLTYVIDLINFSY